MASEIDIDALTFLKNQDQIRLKIGKKLRTACLNSRFTGSKTEECTSTCSLSKNFETKSNCSYVTLPTNNLKGALCHSKNCSMEKVVLF